MNRTQEIYSTAQDIGYQATADKFGIARETVRRMVRKYKQQNKTSEKIDDFETSDQKILDRLKSIYSTQEIEAILSGGTLKPSKAKTIDFSGEHIKLGIISDTHIGSDCFNEQWLLSAFESFKKDKVDFILHVGDVTEGMSNRPDQVYQLTHIGYAAQKQYAIELFNKTDIPIYAIDGNHDRWFIKACGAKIVQDIDSAVPHFHFVGHDYADLKIGGLNIMLWHGEDGASYAKSYRIQKIIESLRGGEKPHLLFAGHVHKHGYFFDRNIHSFLCPTLQKQTSFMRGKRLAADTGFWTVDVTFKDNEVKRCTNTFTPYY